MSKDDSIKWLQRRTEEYRSGKNDMHETIEDFDNMEKLGQGFSLADQLKKLILVMEAFQGLHLSMLIWKPIRKARYVHYLKNLLTALLGIIPRCLV